MDILEAIDQATGCQQCGASLGESVSDDFCSDDCQEDWHAARSTPLEHYDEPWDHWAWHGEYTESRWQPPPPPWRLRRMTSGLAADFVHARQSLNDAETSAQADACRLRLEQLNERQRVVWAREWRLPRMTSDLAADYRAAREAGRTATTDVQRAACRLRLEMLEERRATQKAVFDIRVDFLAAFEAMANIGEQIHQSIARAWDRAFLARNRQPEPLYRANSREVPYRIEVGELTDAEHQRRIERLQEMGLQLPRQARAYERSTLVYESAVTDQPWLSAAPPCGCPDCTARRPRLGGRGPGQRRGSEIIGRARTPGAAGAIGSIVLGFDWARGPYVFQDETGRVTPHRNHRCPIVPIPEPPRDETPRQRAMRLALEARQHRNTGPAQRPPRNRRSDVPGSRR